MKTQDEIMRIYLSARNAINELSAAVRDGEIPECEIRDVEHKLWALSMYADEGRIQAVKKLQPSEAA